MALTFTHTSLKYRCDFSGYKELLEFESKLDILVDLKTNRLTIQKNKTLAEDEWKKMHGEYSHHAGTLLESLVSNWTQLTSERVDLTDAESVSARYGQVVLLQALQRFIGVRVTVLPSLELQQGYAELAKEIEAKAPDFVPADEIDPGLMMNPFDGVLQAINSMREVLQLGMEEFQTTKKLLDKIEAPALKGTSLKALSEQHLQLKQIESRIPTWKKTLMDVVPPKRWCHDEGVLEDLVLFGELLFSTDDILKEGGGGRKVLHLCFGHGEGFDLLKGWLAKAAAKLIELEELHKTHQEIIHGIQKKLDGLNFRSGLNDLEQLKPRPFSDINYADIESRCREIEKRLWDHVDAWRGQEKKLFQQMDLSSSWISQLFQVVRRLRLIRHSLLSSDRWIEDRDKEAAQLPLSELRDELHLLTQSSKRELAGWDNRVSVWLRYFLLRMAGVGILLLVGLGAAAFGVMEVIGLARSIQQMDDQPKDARQAIGYLAVQCRSSLEMKIRSIRIFSKGKSVADFKADVSADKIPFKPIPAGVNAVCLDTSLSPVLGLIVVPERKKVIADLSPWSNPDASKEVLITGVPEGAIISCNDVELDPDIRRIRLIYGRHRLGCRIPGLMEGDQPIIVADDTPSEINLAMPVISIRFTSSPDLQILENGKTVKNKLRHFSSSGQHVIAAVRNGKTLGIFQFESKPGQQLSAVIRPGSNGLLDLEVTEE